MSSYFNEIEVGTLETSTISFDSLTTDSITVDSFTAGTLNAHSLDIPTSSVINVLNTQTINADSIVGTDISSENITCQTLNTVQLNAQNVYSSLFTTNTMQSVNFDTIFSTPDGYTGPVMSMTSFKNGEIDQISDYTVVNSTVSTFSDFQLASGPTGSNKYIITGTEVNSTESIPFITTYNTQLGSFDASTGYGGVVPMMSLNNEQNTLRYELNGKLSLYSDPNTVVWQSTNLVSDVNRKTNIRLIEDGVSRISSLQGVYFNYNSEPEIGRAGLIAQDARDVIPECIIQPTEESYMSIQYEKIIPFLIQSFQTINELE